MPNFVRPLATRFLDDRRAWAKSKTIQTYQETLDSFCAVWGDLEIDKITDWFISNWLQIHPNWSSTTKHTRAQCILTFLKWCFAENFTTAYRVSPKFRMHPSKSRGRKAVWTKEEYQKIHDAADPYFQAFLTAIYETGCRPTLVANMTAQNYDRQSETWIFECHKTDRTGDDLTVYLTQTAIALTESQISLHPTGPLFPSSRGTTYNVHTWQAIVRKLSKKLGLRKGLFIYGLRHTLATDLLSRGESDTVVAHLLGHKSTTMIHKHYSHLSGQSRILKEALAARHR